MKLTKLFFISLIIGLVGLYQCTETEKHRRHEGDMNAHSENLAPVETNLNYKPMEFSPKNIMETFYGGNPNTIAPDRHFLWKDFHKRQYGRPWMHGVVGPQWHVPVPEELTPYNHISSPVPRPDYSTRVIPFDLPDRTHSWTSFDLPLRRNVAQFDLPTSRKHERTQYFDPRFPLMKPVQKVTGTQYHNTGSPVAELNLADNMVPTGKNHQTINSEFYNTGSSFLEKKSHKSKNLKGRKVKPFPPSNSELDKLDHSQVSTLKNLSLSQAKEAEERAYKLLYSMTDRPQGSVNEGFYKIPIQMLNRRDPIEIMHQDNQRLDKLMAYWMTEPIGVRAAHTRTFLPKA